MSGEHGIGYARKDWFEGYYGKDYTNLLRKIKKVAFLRLFFYCRF